MLAPEELPNEIDAKAELAEMCRKWQREGDLTARRAAEMLGIPVRTYEDIVQGRGFRYPKLIVLALLAFR